MKDSLTIEEIDERYIVCGRMEILHILHDLIHRCEPVTLRGTGEIGEVAVQLLDARGQALVFGGADGLGAWIARAGSARCEFVAHPDGIRVQFAAVALRPMSWGGTPAYGVALPERLARVQRQESFRVLVPPEQGLTARLLDADGALLAQGRLHDLSVGGVGVSIDPQAALMPGAGVARVGFCLPQYGDIECAVRLRHATAFAHDTLSAPRRLGLSFSDLPAAVRVTIQRYIIDLEQQRHSQEFDPDDEDDA